MNNTFKLVMTTAAFLYCTATLAQTKYCLNYQGQNDVNAQIQLMQNTAIIYEDIVGSQNPSVCQSLQLPASNYTAVAVFNHGEILQCGVFFAQNPPSSITVNLSVPGNGSSVQCSIYGVANSR